MNRGPGARDAVRSGVARNREVNHMAVTNFKRLLADI